MQQLIRTKVNIDSEICLIFEETKFDESLARAISNNVHKKSTHKVFQVGKRYRFPHYGGFWDLPGF